MLVRMLWPRILYWTAFAFTILGLFYGMTGYNDTVGLQAQSETQTGGAFFALLGVILMMAGKAWMDFVARSRSRLPCPSCGTRNGFAAMHCTNCGFALRAIHSPNVQTLDTAPGQTPALGLVCQACGMRNLPQARFCSSCASSLLAATRHA